MILIFTDAKAIAVLAKIAGQAQVTKKEGVSDKASCDTGFYWSLVQ